MLGVMMPQTAGHLFFYINTKHPQNLMLHSAKSIILNCINSLLI